MQVGSSCWLAGAVRACKKGLDGVTQLILNWESAHRDDRLLVTKSALLIAGSKDSIEGESEKGDWPLSAGWGPHSSHKLREAVYVVNEGVLAHELLLALQVLLLFPAYANR